MPLADNGVDFPVAQPAAPLHHRLALLDGDAAGQNAAAVVGTVALAPALLAA